MGYTTRMLVLWGPERSSFLDELNAIIATEDFGASPQGVQFHAPTTGRVGSGALGFFSHLDHAKVQDALKSLNPDYPEDVTVVWTTEHGNETTVHKFTLHTDREKVDSWDDFLPGQDQ